MHPIRTTATKGTSTSTLQFFQKLVHLILSLNLFSHSGFFFTCGLPQLLNSSLLQHASKPRPNIVNMTYWTDSRFKQFQMRASKDLMVQNRSSSELPRVCGPSWVVMLHELDQVFQCHNNNNAKYSSCFRYFWSHLRKHGLHVFFNQSPWQCFLRLETRLHFCVRTYSAFLHSTLLDDLALLRSLLIMALTLLSSTCFYQKWLCISSSLLIKRLNTIRFKN